MITYTLWFIFTICSNAVLGCNFKNNRMISVCFQGKPYNIHSNSSLCPTTNSRKLKLNGLWRPTRSRTNTQKRCPLHYRRLECKNRKSRDTWSNRQIWCWSTKWSRKKANRVCWENALVIANTLFQHQKQINTWTPDGQYWNQIDYILCSQR